MLVFTPEGIDSCVTLSKNNDIFSPTFINQADVSNHNLGIDIQKATFSRTCMLHVSLLGGHYMLNTPIIHDKLPGLITLK